MGTVTTFHLVHCKLSATEGNVVTVPARAHCPHPTVPARTHPHARTARPAQAPQRILARSYAWPNFFFKPSAKRFTSMM
jgi:hypothetical protein